MTLPFILVHLLPADVLSPTSNLIQIAQVDHMNDVSFMSFASSPSICIICNAVSMVQCQCTDLSGGTVGTAPVVPQAILRVDVPSWYTR
jgi:hypothetical protein